MIDLSREARELLAGILMAGVVMIAGYVIASFPAQANSAPSVTVQPPE